MQLYAGQHNDFGARLAGYAPRRGHAYGSRSGATRERRYNELQTRRRWRRRGIRELRNLRAIRGKIGPSIPILGVGRAVVLAAGLEPERLSVRAQILARSGTLPMAMCQVKGSKGLISSFCRVIR